jgi:hypothetical protein
VPSPKVCHALNPIKRTEEVILPYDGDHQRKSISFSYETMSVRTMLGSGAYRPVISAVRVVIGCVMLFT